MMTFTNLYQGPFITASFFMSLVSAQQGTTSVCTSTNNVFHVQVDLFSSTFAECGDLVNPTLGLRRGENYTFVQSDRTNYFHPFGINDVPNINYEGQNVVENEYYERAFHTPPQLWAARDDFSVNVRFDDPLVTQTTYYCIIHYGMEGNIQILPPSTEAKNTLVATVTSGASDFVDKRSEFDKKCGTTGLNEFQLPSNLCPDRFVCGTELVSLELREFSECLEAANCAMMSGMTTGVRATADSALFIHQMIPHHENAVNTAKTLLKTGNLLCPDLTDVNNPDCVLEGILLEIVANQNHQIQRMQSFLETRRYPATDNCDVYVQTVQDAEVLGLVGDTSLAIPTTTTSDSWSNMSNLWVILTTLVSLVWTIGR